MDKEHFENGYINSTQVKTLASVGGGGVILLDKRWTRTYLLWKSRTSDGGLERRTANSDKVIYDEKEIIRATGIGLIKILILFRRSSKKLIKKAMQKIGFNSKISSGENQFEKGESCSR